MFPHFRNLPSQATRVLRAVWLTSGLGFLALSIAGCGIKTVDAPQLEQDLRLQLEKALQVNVLAVSCPEGEKLEQGNRFECRLEAGTKSEQELSVALRVVKSGSLRITDISQSGDSASEVGS